jgi:hypothetical protein
VRTQVDHDLTTVSRFDRLLRVNKNLGHHNPGPGARPVWPAAGTPATRCQSARPPRGRRGSHTGPGTSQARCSTERGGCTLPELSPPAPVTSSQGRGRRQNQETHEHYADGGANLEFDEKHLPGRSESRDPRGSTAPRSARC